MKPLRILIEARWLLLDPLKWEKSAAGYGDPNAEKFCMMGACLKVSGALAFHGADPLDRANMHKTRGFLKEVLNHKPITQFNDNPNTTHKMLIAKFDEAIALAQRESI